VRFAAPAAEAMVNWLLAAGNAGARPENDPILGAFGASSNWSQAGTLQGLTPASLGAALTDYHNGSYASIAPLWEVMQRRDDACATAWPKLRRKVKAQLRNWTIQPVDDSPEAARQADWLKAFYNRLRGASAIDPRLRGGLGAAVAFMLDAVPKQYACLGKAWSGQGDTLTLNLQFVPLWFFRAESGVMYFSPQYGSATGTPIQDEQWLIAAQPEAVMEAASVLCLFKRLPMHQLVHILEKWGIPSAYGKTSAEKGSHAWNNLMDAVGAVVSGFSGVLGGDATINELKTAFRSADMHQPWIDRCDRVITTLFLGGSLSTTAESGTGTLAGGAQADDMDDIVRDLCDWLTETANEQIDRQALALGLGIDEPLAWFQLRKPDAADDAADMDILERGVRLGARVPVSYVYDRFSLPEAAAAEPALTAPQAPAPFDPSYPSDPHTGGNCAHGREPFRLERLSAESRYSPGLEFAPFPSQRRAGTAGRSGPAHGQHTAGRQQGLCRHAAEPLERHGESP